MKVLSLKPNQHIIVWDYGHKLKILDGKRDMDSLLRGNDKDVIEEFEVGKDATLEYYFIWQNTPQERNLTIHLIEEGASAKLMGVFLCDDESRVELNSTMIHHAPNTYGNTFIKGALQDSSRAKLSGMIKIEKGAHGSDDLLTERVLLLSPKARAEAVPMLEIDANEVRATHAATISRINKDYLYYLQTRGLPQIDSKKFLVNGFLQEVIDLFPKELRKHLT